MAALRVFDAAARHGSFSRASDTLGVTPAAVSYQIRLLEERVGTMLFDRQARGVKLTPAGARFAKEILPAMDAIGDAFRSAKGASQQFLKVNVIPTFATQFLSGAIWEFQKRHETVHVQLEISENTVGIETVECDLAIRLGSGDFGRLESRLLFPALFTPMMSPVLLEGIDGVLRPEDLLKLPILSPGDPRWQTWLRAADVKTDGFAPNASLHFGTQTVEAQAAVAGQGIAMLTPAFFQRELQAKLLVQPFDLLGDDGNSYWLVHGNDLATSQKVRSFRNWLLRRTEVYRTARSERAEES